MDHLWSVENLTSRELRQVSDVELEALDLNAPLLSEIAARPIVRAAISGEQWERTLVASIPEQSMLCSGGFERLEASWD